MSNFKITARHPGIGTVAFVIESTDTKAAFGLWRNIVFSPRQWSIVSNEPTGAAVVHDTVDPYFGDPDLDEL